MSACRSFCSLSLRSRWICEKCVYSAAPRSKFWGQRRWITHNHIRKIVTAEEEWQLRQEEIRNGKRKSMLAILEERGYVNQIVGGRDDLETLLSEKRVGVYAGVDPTAPSLHIGHMVPFMALGWMYIHGYSATFLVRRCRYCTSFNTNLCQLGGFTASVGDPIGRLTGREQQTTKTRTLNATCMHQQLKKLGASMETYAAQRGYLREWAWRRSLQNNYTWWQKLTMKDFLKVLGTGTRIGPMLGRDTVKNRLDSGDGMSFSEFSYPLIQAWDWWELYQKGTQVQIGGADQFGNILAGAEAVKHLAKNDPVYVHEHQKTGLSHKGDKGPSLEEPMGFTVPLLTTSSGEKFGKSAGNAIWLDPDMTSSFDLYQFFLRSADADVERYLKLFTFLSLQDITKVMTEQHKDESKRIAQHTLAAEFVQMVHGEKAAKEAETQHRQLFDKKLTLGDIQAQLKASRELVAQTDAEGKIVDINPSLNKHAKPLDMHTGGEVNIQLPESLVVQQPLSRILWSAGLVASRSEGQRMINNKGVYIGGQKGKDTQKSMEGTLNFAQIEDAKWSSVTPFILEGNLIILRVGKWRMKVITIVSDSEYEASGRTCPGWKESVDQESNAPNSKTDQESEEQARLEAYQESTEKIKSEASKASRDHRRTMYQHKST